MQVSDLIIRIEEWAVEYRKRPFVLGPYFQLPSVEQMGYTCRQELGIPHEFKGEVEETIFDTLRENNVEA